MPIVRRIAYLGPQLSFTHIALMKAFSQDAHVPYPSITDAIHATERGEASAAFVPLENSINGPVPETLDLLADTMLHINTVVEMPIVLVAAGNPHSDRVYGHPHALAEAREWLRTIKPTPQEMPALSTSHAAEMAKKENALCICSREAAEEKGLNIIAENVGPPDNITRFALLEWRDNPSKASRTYVASILPDTPGSLYRYLEPFASEGVNLTMIYSRPARGKPWKYVFYVEMEGSRSREEVSRALKGARERSLMQKVLGSYPVTRI